MFLLVKALKNHCQIYGTFSTIKIIQLNIFWGEKSHETLNCYLFTLLSVEVFKIHCCLQA